MARALTCLGMTAIALFAWWLLITSVEIAINRMLEALF